MLAILAAILAAVVVFVLFFSRIYILDWIMYKLPPGPRPVPLLGTIGAMARVRKTGIKQGFRIIHEIAKNHGKMTMFYTGQVRMVALCDPDLIQEAFVTRANEFSARPHQVIKIQTNIGVISAHGDAWRTKRRFVMRSMREFGMGRSNIVESVHDETGFLIQEIERRAGKPFVPHHLIGNAVSNIICSIVFGKRFDYEDPFFKSLLEVTAELFASELGGDVIPLIFPALQNFYVPKQMKLLQRLEKLIMDMLAQSIEEHRKTFSKDHIRNFADIFIDTELGEDGLPLQEFARIALDLFLAGTETTATALLWTIAWFCKHPDIQKRSIETIDTAMGATDRFPTLDDKPAMTYIDAVMYEALRHPSVAPQGVLHGTIDGGKLGDYDIPPKTILMANIWAVHHNESFWKDANTFNPDRFLDSKGKLISHGNHFMPFGIGPRICLGESLARVEYFIFLVSMLQRFSFSFAPGENVDVNGGFSGITYVPPHYKVIASPRT